MSWRQLWWPWLLFRVPEDVEYEIKQVGPPPLIRLTLYEMSHSMSAGNVMTTFFSLAATPSVLLLSSPKLQVPGSRPRGTASDPIPKLSNQGLEIIVVTPKANSPEAMASASVYSQHLKRITQRSTYPTAQVFTSESDLERDPPFRMVEESKQIFKGLCFFYIPNDDAREHGAIWTRDAYIATHIKPTLDRNPTSPSAILVNDKYPIDFERRRYETIKQRKHDKLAETSYPGVIQSLKVGAEATDLYPKSGPCDATKNRIFMDELATCIDAVLDDPEKHEYLDDSDLDGQALEDDGPSKKKVKGCPRPRGTNANTTFNQDKFMCIRGGTRDKKTRGPNAATIKLLEEMAEEHRLSDDTWRIQSYRKAVATLRRQPKKITTAKEAAGLPNIGSSLAKHIEEIVITGRFEKLDNIRNKPSREALKTFCDVYGVGVPTAKRWVDLGYRTLNDLQTKATLTTNQQLGVEHYNDLLTRIPRTEVTALGNHVKDVAAAIDPTIELVIGGSYRRGAETSGDIDVIVTKNGTSSTQDLMPFLDELVAALMKAGFLTAALAEHRRNGGNKWHGCCVLPEAAFPGPKEEYRPIWRRIDFLLVPQTEIGAALVYFTGNDLFNRSMRLLARKKKMKLNHRALSGVGIYEGRDEKKIFEILGVPWREPHERWC
ncbi:hypothetical protein F5Y08DRAFT_332436 [Xylaria arbuscula]|nr:hypothetical protein F5Y08DRAFT_332436 [Xylaria arbuscula]